MTAQAHDWTDLLACPKCHGKLARVQAPEGFGCASCALLYAVDDGLPNMLIEEAKPWSASTAGAQ